MDVDVCVHESLLYLCISLLPFCFCASAWPHMFSFSPKYWPAKTLRPHTKPWLWPLGLFPNSFWLLQFCCCFIVSHMSLLESFVCRQAEILQRLMTNYKWQSSFTHFANFCVNKSVQICGTYTMVTQLYIQKLYKTLCEKILRLFSQKINVKKKYFISNSFLSNSR